MPPALRFLILVASGWVNRRQQDVIDYLKEENRVLREQLGVNAPDCQDEAHLTRLT